MDTAEEAQTYEEMDHAEVNRKFIDDLIAGGEVGEHVIDLGCGPAAISIGLCERQEDVRVVAIDIAVSMLEVAKIQIDFAGMLDRISLEHGDAKVLQGFQEGMADTVISNSLLHHLEEPHLAIASAIRLLHGEGRLFFRDLARPKSEATIEALVSQYAGEEPEFAQQLFRQSLHAALTIDEIKEIVGGLGISSDDVQMTSDRHWTLDCQSP